MGGKRMSETKQRKFDDVQINMCFVDVEKDKLKARTSKSIQLNRETEEIVIPLEGKTKQQER